MDVIELLLPASVSPKSQNGLSVSPKSSNGLSISHKKLGFNKIITVLMFYALHIAYLNSFQAFIQFDSIFLQFFFKLGTSRY